MADNDASNEPLSFATHLIATILSVAGLSLLVTLAAVRGTAMHVVGFSIFGASLVLLYFFSTLYHFLSKNHPAKDLFRILDHVMIYVLIAGTYTPLVLLVLPASWGWGMFGAVWGLALCGVLIKTLRLAIPQWVSVVFYILMGWLILIAVIPLKEALSIEAFLWLLAGGIFYTIGVIFFALEGKIMLNKWYTPHDILHIFDMLGSFCHFWFMFKFVLPA
ncbi:MAG: hemolysin III family protein [bacterium]|nr:hemolysin III family protein [bacterium]